MQERDDPDSVTLAGRAAALLVLLAVTAAAAPVLASFAAALSFPYDLLDALEGSYLAEAEAIARGAPLYTGPADRPFISQIYPPGFPAAVRLFLPFFDAPILAGRWAGAVFLAILCALAASIVGRETGSAALAAAAALAPLALLSPHFALGHHYHMFHAVVLAAFVAAVRGRPVAAAVLSAGAGTVRQTGLLVPLLCVGILRATPRTAARVGAAGFLLSGAFHTALAAGAGPEYLRNCFLEVAAHPLRRENLEKAGRYLVWNIAPVGLALAAARLGGPPFSAVERGLAEAGIGWAVASAVTSGKVGSGTAHFIAGAIPLWLAALARIGRTGGAAALAAAALLACVAWGNVRPARLPDERHWRDGEELSRLIETADGPVLVDRHLGLLLPGRVPEYDVARVFEAWRFEGFHPRTFVEDIRARRYALVLSSRIYEPAEAAAALDEGYVETGEIVSGNPIWYRFHVLRRREP